VVVSRVTRPDAVRVLVDDRWVEGYLDPSPKPREYLLGVTHWVTGVAVDGLFFERPSRLGLIVNYARNIGVRNTVRRIRSRRAERVRNRRFVACGVGRVLTGPAGADGHPAGTEVAFVATRAPLCADRVAAHEALVLVPAASVPPASPGTLLHVEHEAPAPALASLAGWSDWSGIELDDEAVAEAHAACETVLAEAPWHEAARLPAPGDAVASTADAGSRPRRSGRPSAVLVGYGNYAKTTILPNLGRDLDVRAVHEIDPLQLGPRGGDPDVAWSTDPNPDVDRFDAVLAAGYHHTHAPLAVEALARGKAAVIEKPLATTHDQLDLVAQAAQGAEGRLFLCFQRRYTRLNDHAREDLGVGEGDPIDYHCVVFEEPLPARHWYAWPSSGTRLVSNGCHWIDHFLYLNAFSAPRQLAAESPRKDLVNVTATLDNGAVFTMVLTDSGSPRVGMREHVELRSGDVTVKIVDGRDYEAESSRRRLRRASVNKLDAYRRMYRTIAERIASGLPGDDLRADLLSARVTLDLQAAMLGRGERSEVPAPSAALRGG
jgi:predicted dehydrogenase